MLQQSFTSTLILKKNHYDFRRCPHRNEMNNSSQASCHELIYSEDFRRCMQTPRIEKKVFL